MGLIDGGVAEHWLAPLDTTRALRFGIESPPEGAGFPSA
jgi:hypothetical protein